LFLAPSHSVDAELAKEGHFYERSQYFPRSADRAVHDPAAPLDAQVETTDCGVSITKDVPILRIDHVSIKGKLLGVWQTFYSGGVLDFKEMTRTPHSFLRIFPSGRSSYAKHQICGES
jgi:hypothetical protein